MKYLTGMNELSATQYGAAGAYLMCGRPLTAFLVFALGLWVDYVYRHRLRIQDAGDVYLDRYHLIRTRWFRVFLHRIHRSDKDRDSHNHPWPTARAFVLWGGYQEKISEPCDRMEVRDVFGHVIVEEAHYEDFFRYHRRFDLSSEAFEPQNYHRITRVIPNTWTLFFAGRRSRDWGFLTDKGHVPCRVYLGLPSDHDFGD